MKIYEIGTGYTSIPAQISAATEIVVEQLAKAMLEKGENVHIIDIYDPNRPQTSLPLIEIMIPRILINADIELGIVHKLKRVVYSIALSRKLKNILKSAEEKTILHFHNQYNLFFFAKMVPKRLQSKCIVAYTNHSGIWSKEWDQIDTIIKKRYFQEKISMECADFVFALNKKMQDNIVNHTKVKKNRIFVIENGVNINVYHPLSKIEINQIKEKYGLVNKKVIIQVGSVCENKNQLLSIKILESLLKNRTDVMFLYAGGIVSREYQEKITTYTKLLQLQGNVKYCGMMQPGKELNEFYNIADAMMLSSDYEGFSLAVVEALSAGIPIIIRKGKMYNLYDGCLFYDEYSDNSKLISNEIFDSDKRIVYSQKARMFAEKNFMWKKICEDYLFVIGNNDLIKEAQ